MIMPMVKPPRIIACSWPPVKKSMRCLLLQEARGAPPVCASSSKKPMSCRRKARNPCSRSRWVRRAEATPKEHVSRKKHR